MSKIAIFSDTHLTSHFHPKKYEYLKSLVSKYDKIIINGDFWSYYSLRFDDFVKSEWKKLFPALKNKAIYIYGNHDRKHWCDERVSLFSQDQMNKYELILDRKKLTIMHGHTLLNDSIKNEVFIKYHRKLKIDQYNYSLQNFMITRFGLANYEKRPERIVKKYIEHTKNLPDDEILVTGHLHMPLIKIEDKYVNSGYINYGNASYIEIKSNELNLVREVY